MKQSVFTLVTLLLSISVWGNGDIDYGHKAIQKTLVKTCQLLNPSLSEMVFADDSMPQTVGKFFEVKHTNTDQEKLFLYIGRVNSCRAGGCSMSNNAPQQGDSEYFDYMVLFNDQCEVTLVKVFNYQASHGHEVTAKGWLKQFIGYHTEGEELEVGRNIDSISGATISVNGITNDIQAKTQVLKSYLSAL